MKRAAGGALTAVVGVADHIGWAECVTVAASRKAPVVIDRRRIALIEPGVPRAPYHHEAVFLPLPEAETLAARVRASVQRQTLASLSELRRELEPPYRIAAVTLRKPTLSTIPVTVVEAHRTRAIMMSADAMMYHDALCTTARRLGIDVEFHGGGEELVRAAEALDTSIEELEAFLEGLRESFGPPWHKEHRLAAAAAIGVLSTRVRLTALYPD
jgi:hypothetical protein